MLRGFSFILFIVILSALSCEYDNAERIFIESQGEIKFSEEVFPIINQHCSFSTCHVAGAAIGNFSDYNQLKARVDNGKLQKMVFELRLMPPAASSHLSEMDYSVLKRWIAGGATE